MDFRVVFLEYICGFIFRFYEGMVLVFRDLAGFGRIWLFVFGEFVVFRAYIRYFWFYSYRERIVRVEVVV